MLITLAPHYDQARINRAARVFGYVVDDVIPLCAAGADDPLNMQWWTIDDAKAKDRTEANECNGKRRA